MSPEMSLITRDQVSQAEQRVGYSHPIIAVLDRHLPQITQLHEGFSSISGNQEQQEYIRQNYGFLADAVVEAGSFTLQPLEMVAVWSRAMEIFPSNLYHRYALARIITSAYAIQGLEATPAWKSFPRHFFETNNIPDELVEDRLELEHLKWRISDIGRSIDELDFYSYGTREDAMEVAFKLGKRANQEGDVEAQEQLDKLISYQKEHKTPVLGAIHENWGIGLSSTYRVVQAAIEKGPSVPSMDWFTAFGRKDQGISVVVANENFTGPKGGEMETHWSQWNHYTGNPVSEADTSERAARVAIILAQAETFISDKTGFSPNQIVETIVQLRDRYEGKQQAPIETEIY